jgi:hypothetical protein
MRHRIFKVAGVAGAAVTACLMLAGCPSHPNADMTEQNAQTAQQRIYDNNQPLPQYNWSLERQVLIDAQDSAARGDASTSFFFVQGVQDPVFICPSLGLGVPDTAQLSNPDQIAPISGRWGGGATVIGQMDPFGVYTPPTSEGTYVICVINGRPTLQRAEEYVHTVMAPAVWDVASHQIKVTGTPSLVLNTKPPAGTTAVRKP